MLQRLREIWSGTPEEQQAALTIRKFGTGRHLSSTQEHALQQARVVRGRLGRRRFLIEGGGVISAAGLALAGIREVAKEEADNPHEEVYLRYLQAFEAVSQGDEEAIELLRFFKERRKQGVYKGHGNVVAGEEGNPTRNFYTGIVPADESLVGRGNLPGFSAYFNQSHPTYLLLINVPVDPLFAGVILAHEAKHVYQWLNGIEQARPNGFFLGEQEAFETEFRLLDRNTGGKFSNVLKEQSQSIPEGKYRALLSTENMQAISEVFPPPLSEREWRARIPDYVIALNFTAMSLRAPSPEQAKQQQVDYIKGIFDGSVKLIGVNS